MTAQESDLGQEPAALSWRFWTFWSAHAASNLADGFFRLALPLFATQLTRDPRLIAGVSFALTLPWLVLSVPIGALVDRWDRRVAILLANSVRVAALLICTFLIAMQQGHLLLIYGVALCLGIAETIADTAAGALVPALVPTSRLEQANARLVGVQIVTNQFLGPPLGGALAVLGTVYALGTSSVLYLLTVLLVLHIRGGFIPKRPVSRSLRQDMLAGIRFIWEQPVLRLLTILIAGLNFCLSAYDGLIVLYAVAPGPLGLTPFQYGLLLASSGVGGVIGAYLVALLQERLAWRWLIMGEIYGALLLFATLWFSRNIYLVVGASLIAGITGGMFNIIVVSIRQRLVPDAMLGCTAGASRMCSFGALSLGAASAGGIAHVIGIRGVFGCCAAIILVLLLVCLFLLPSVTNEYGVENATRALR